MPSLRNRIVFLVMMVSMLAASSFVFAESTSCTCFCGTSQVGADSVDTQASSVACQSLCEKESTTYVGCYKDATEYPQSNPLCWTESECVKSTDWYGATTTNGEWGGQGAVCSQGSGYCYRAASPVTLNVAIGDLTSVTDFPTYLNAVYGWLLEAAFVVAVVMIMVGGLQYVLARGDAGLITKAKERMGKAVVGVVILLFVYAIVNLIDPRLRTWSPLKLPKPKEIVLVDKNTSCESLSEYGFGINNSQPGSPGKPATTGICAATGTVTSIPDASTQGATLYSSTWKEGDQCSFSTCNAGEVCVSGTGCQRCERATNASDSVCTALSAEATEDGTGGTKYYCTAVSDGGITACADVSTSSGATETGLSCEKLRSVQSPTPSGCTTYTSGLFYNFNSTYTTLTTTLFTAPLASQSVGQGIFQSICETDPCGLASYVSSTGCIYTASDDKTSGTCTNKTESTGQTGRESTYGGH